MIAFSHSTNSSSRSGAVQLMLTSDWGMTVVCVTTAVNAQAACSKASAGVFPHPRIPTSASWPKCSHLAPRMGSSDGPELMAAALAPTCLVKLKQSTTFCALPVDANQHGMPSSSKGYGAALLGDG